MGMGRIINTHNVRAVFQTNSVCVGENEVDDGGGRSTFFLYLCLNSWSFKNCHNKSYCWGYYNKFVNLLKKKKVNAMTVRLIFACHYLKAFLWLWGKRDFVMALSFLYYISGEIHIVFMISYVAYAAL